MTQNSAAEGTETHTAALRGPLWILAALAVFTTLYLASALFIPIALALYLSIVLSPAVELLRRARLPRPIAAAVIMLLLVSILGVVVDRAAPPAREWLDRAPSLLKEVERKLRPLQRVAVKIDQVSEHAGRVAAGAPGSTDAPVPVQARSLLRDGPALLLPAAAVIFMTYFLLACGPQILMSFALRPRRSVTARQIVAIVEHARSETARYLGTLTLINVGLGAATSILAMSFDLPTPLLWGVMAAVLNFIPYAGSAITLTALAVVTVLTHDELGPAFGIAGSYLLIATVEGQLVQPLAIGRRLALNPLMVFLALWLWGWLWGVAGLLLATPMLLMVKAISVRIPAWKSLADLLGPARRARITTQARAWRRYKVRGRRQHVSRAAGSEAS